MTGIHYLAHSIHERPTVETNCSRVGISYQLFGIDHFFLMSNSTCHLHWGGGEAMNSGEEGLKYLSFCNTWMLIPIPEATVQTNNLNAFFIIKSF